MRWSNGSSLRTISWTRVCWLIFYIYFLWIKEIIEWKIDTFWGALPVPYFTPWSVHFLLQLCSHLAFNSSIRFLPSLFTIFNQMIHIYESIFTNYLCEMFLLLELKKVQFKDLKKQQKHVIYIFFLCLLIRSSRKTHRLFFYFQHWSSSITKVKKC